MISSLYSIQARWQSSVTAVTHDDNSKMLIISIPTAEKNTTH